MHNLEEIKANIEQLWAMRDSDQSELICVLKSGSKSITLDVQPSQDQIITVLLQAQVVLLDQADAQLVKDHARIQDMRSDVGILVGTIK